jgi:hypothetical protein
VRFCPSLAPQDHLDVADIALALRCNSSLDRAKLLDELRLVRREIPLSASLSRSICLRTAAEGCG